MKAPNGKTTNLTEKQWLMVRTKAFKKWFGDWEKEPHNKVRPRQVPVMLKKVSKGKYYSNPEAL
jgi:hypothetical protein